MGDLTMTPPRLLIVALLLAALLPCLGLGRGHGHGQRREGDTEAAGKWGTHRQKDMAREEGWSYILILI